MPRVYSDLRTALRAQAAEYVMIANTLEQQLDANVYKSTKSINEAYNKRGVYRKIAQELINLLAVYE